MPGSQDRRGGFISFWGMVGATMAALQLKERWDKYRAVSSEEGPVALHSPLLTPVDPGNMSTFDTQSQSNIKYKRKKGCCGCCGGKCGLFWKAFGIVCLLFIGWQTIKFIWWMLTPSPTGLEGMPEFSTSLGCLDVPYSLQESSKARFSIPIDLENGGHTIDIHGGAVGTPTLVAGAAHTTEIDYELKVLTDAQTLMDDVTLSYPMPGRVEDGLDLSRLELRTPLVDSASCMRYDLVVTLPPTLRSLIVKTKSLTQVRFDPSSEFDLEYLSVQLQNFDARNMLLPHEHVRATTNSLLATGGWLVGRLSIVSKTIVYTHGSNATLNVHIFPAPSANASLPALLETSTGPGRADVFYARPPDAHRSIASEHNSQRGGDLYLTYKDAQFSGTVDLQAVIHFYGRPAGGDPAVA